MKLTEEQIKEHERKRKWLKKWGAFSDKELDAWPFSVVDVMDIMELVGKDAKRKFEASTPTEAKLTYSGGVVSVDKGEIVKASNIILNNALRGNL